MVRINPTVDRVLTASYLLSVALTVYLLSLTGEVLWLGVALVATSLAIQISGKLFLTFGRFISSSFLFDPPFHDPMKKAVVAKKFVDQGWQLVMHCSMSLLEFYVLSGEEWFSRTASVWEQRGTPLKPSLRALYIIQLAIWIYTGFSHKYIELKRKDYVEMFLHHIVTILLMAGSWSQDNTRVGLLVLFLHDTSDIFIDLMKMANYLRLKDRPAFFLSEALYSTAVLFWIYLRLYLFPFFVIYSAYAESIQSPPPPGCGPQGAGCWGLSHPFLSSVVLLCVLECLHIFWFLLLLRIGYRALTAGDIHNAASANYEGGSTTEDETQYDNQTHNKKSHGG